MRVFAVSDIHLDYDVNLAWLLNLSKSEYKEDVLILAGDISDVPHLLGACFESLATKFKKVLYVPGNHDLWVNRQEQKTSLEKFDFVCTLAQEHGVSLQPYREDSVAIVPLLSWYDYSFGYPGDELKAVWMDFRMCTWPENFDITQHFLAANEPVLTRYEGAVISFSHFLPRIDVMPAFIPPSKRTLYPVLGTKLLDEQVRAIDSKIHIYGHSHVNRRVKIDGICYINNAFGYPSETMITAKKLVCVYEN